ncbi:DUF1684 domain-containing protein [Dokdonella immobilis]|uniref:DUF1684 domain-containing protein n=1 Tax=Dokdonella immobilis TaxID=578942 RepID=A0A1I4WKM2_9GAMM|nr:DUF1684 domain-containing protein [Dokdonella immobilis]SFN14007.1 hypothetical protein SAMN05216289_105103 [Dokdonella immobilis]
MLMTSLLMAASLSGAQVIAADSGDDYAREIESWRAGRLERLQSPTGWLSLVGLEWLKPGRNTVGAASDNDIVIAGVPDHLGRVDWDGDKVNITLKADSGALIDGQLVESAEMLDDSHEKPTTVSFDSVRFYLVERAGGKKGLRIKDSKAETRTHFLGLDHYPVDPSWRIEARWVAFDPPHTLEIPNVLGTIDKMTVPGKAVFVHDGKSFELLPVLETDDADELFYIFADKTSGKETYGAGRFFYSAMPKDGKVVLDFNKAYNPPCAFTPYATCPLAPPENRMPVAVHAGEKKYRGSKH